MRFDNKILFVRETEGTYDESTGDYGEGSTHKIEKLANVTDASTQTMQLVYGHIRQGALVIRIQGVMLEPFDYIRVDGKKYRVDMSRKLRQKSTFVVSEVQ